jgi:hypothetical protein
MQLQGTDINEKPLEELSAKENVSQKRVPMWLHGSTEEDSTIEVYLVGGGTKFVGRHVWSDARGATRLTHVMRSDSCRKKAIGFRSSALLQCALIAAGLHTESVIGAA